MIYSVIPPIGVYAVKVVIGPKQFNGMANIGCRPSFKKKGNEIMLEVHIFNFSKLLYGKEIIVEFIKKIRKERFFASQEKLVSQLKRDTVRSKQILHIL